MFKRIVVQTTAVVNHNKFSWRAADTRRFLTSSVYVRTLSPVYLQPQGSVALHTTKQAPHYGTSNYRGPHVNMSAVSNEQAHEDGLPPGDVETALDSSRSFMAIRPVARTSGNMLVVYAIRVDTISRVMRNEWDDGGLMASACIVACLFLFHVASITVNGRSKSRGG